MLQYIEECNMPCILDVAEVSKRIEEALNDNHAVGFSVFDGFVMIFDIIINIHIFFLCHISLQRDSSAKPE